MTPGQAQVEPHPMPAMPKAGLRRSKDRQVPGTPGRSAFWPLCVPCLRPRARLVISSSDRHAMSRSPICLIPDLSAFLSFLDQSLI